MFINSRASLPSTSFKRFAMIPLIREWSAGGACMSCSLGHFRKLVSVIRRWLDCVGRARTCRRGLRCADPNDVISGMETASHSRSKGARLCLRITPTTRPNCISDDRTTRTERAENLWYIRSSAIVHRETARRPISVEFLSSLEQLMYEK